MAGRRRPDIATERTELLAKLREVREAAAKAKQLPTEFEAAHPSPAEILARQRSARENFFSPQRPLVQIIKPAEVEPIGRLADVVVGLKRQAQRERQKPGVKKTEVSTRVRRQVALLRIGGASVAEIMRRTRLSKTIATRLVRDVDDALGKIRAGRY